MRKRRPSRSARSWAQQCAHLLADHQHAGQGKGDRGQVAPLSAADLVPQPVQPGRGRGRRRAGRRGPGRLSADCAPLLRAQGQVVGVTQLDYWDRNAPLPEADDRRIPWPEARDIVLERLSRLFPRAGRDRARASSTSLGSTRRRDPANPPAPSPIRRCPRSIPICC